MDASHPIESELNFSLDFFGKFKKEITTTTTAATATTATTATRKWMLQCHKSWRAFWPIWCRGRNDVIGSLFPQQGHAILLYAAFPFSPSGNTNNNNNSGEKKQQQPKWGCTYLALFDAAIGALGHSSTYILLFSIFSSASSLVHSVHLVRLTPIQEVLRASSPFAAARCRALHSKSNSASNSDQINRPAPLLFKFPIDYSAGQQKE